MVYLKTLANRYSLKIDSIKSFSRTTFSEIQGAQFLKILIIISNIPYVSFSLSRAYYCARTSFVVVTASLLIVRILSMIWHKSFSASKTTFAEFFRILSFK